MKAVLVIDMPKNCGVCPIAEYILFENGKARIDAGGNCPIENNYIADDKWNERPSWCPIKPFPEKKEEACRMEESLMNAGWNACLNEILGEKEE